MRSSRALVQFIDSIRDTSGLSILDLGEICQENVSFLTSLGHRLCSVDFLRTLETISVDDDPPGGPSQRNRMEAFVDQTLGFDPQSLDAALIWDALDFLSRPLLLLAVERLHQILRPGAHMLVFIHSAERGQPVPVYSNRIADPGTLHLALRGRRVPVQYFNSRGIERLFERFESVKFFLTRDNLREVIVRR